VDGEEEGIKASGDVVGVVEGEGEAASMNRVGLKGVGVNGVGLNRVGFTGVEDATNKLREVVGNSVADAISDEGEGDWSLIVIKGGDVVRYVYVSRGEGVSKIRVGANSDLVGVLSMEYSGAEDGVYSGAEDG